MTKELLKHIQAIASRLPSEKYKTFNPGWKHNRKIGQRIESEHPVNHRRRLKRLLLTHGWSALMEYAFKRSQSEQVKWAVKQLYSYLNAKQLNYIKN